MLFVALGDGARAEVPELTWMGLTYRPLTRGPVAL